MTNMKAPAACRHEQTGKSIAGTQEQMTTYTAARQKKYEKGRLDKQDHQQQTDRTVWKTNSSQTEEI